MLIIWKVKYLNQVFEGKEFNIDICLFYFIFPFSKIYLEIWRDGKRMGRRERMVFFPIGIWKQKFSDTIWKDTEYNIRCGYEK